MDFGSTSMSIYVLCDYCIMIADGVEQSHHYIIHVDSAGFPTDRASTFPRFPIRLERFVGERDGIL